MSEKTLGKLRRGDRIHLLGKPHTVMTVGAPNPTGLVHVTFQEGGYVRGHVSNTITIEDVA